MAETVLVGDVEAGDVITLPGTGREMVVRRVQLGHGGFLLTVAPAEAGAAAGGGPVTVWTLTAGTQLSRRRRVPARLERPAEPPPDGRGGTAVRRPRTGGGA